MKKIILSTMMCVLCGLAAFSATKTTETYYGSKTGDSNGNPCKGATTRVCGTKVIETAFIAINQTKINETVFDDENRLIKTLESIVNLPETIVNARILQKAASNGADIEIEEIQSEIADNLGEGVKSFPHD